MTVVRLLREAARTLANAIATAFGTIGGRLLALRNLGRSNGSAQVGRLKELRGAEEQVREETFAAFGEEVAVLEHALGLIHHVLGRAGGFALDHTFLQGLLASRAAGSLRCAWLCAAAGYRTQALTLVRAALEDYATAVWVAEKPEDAELWLWEIVDSLPEPNRRPPRFAEMFEHLGRRNGGSDDVFKNVYGYLSEAAHPRAPGLQWGAGAEAQVAQLLPIFDEPSTASCLHHLLLITGLVLGVAVSLYASTLPGTADENDELLAESLAVRLARDRSLTGRAAGLAERSAGVPALAGRCRGRCRSEEPSQDRSGALRARELGSAVRGHAGARLGPGSAL